jgi:hypothetical protein
MDESGRTFRERIEVTLKDDGPEWDEEEAGLDFWRARGKVRAVDIKDGETTEEEEVTGLLKE